MIRLRVGALSVSAPLLVGAAGATVSMAAGAHKARQEQPGGAGVEYCGRLAGGAVAVAVAGRGKIEAGLA